MIRGEKKLALEVAGKARQWIGPGEVTNMTLGGVDVLHMTFGC